MNSDGSNATDACLFTGALFLGVFGTGSVSSSGIVNVESDQSVDIYTTASQ